MLWAILAVLSYFRRFGLFWSFWVLILAAGGPYCVLISQKNGSLLGPYLKAWGSLLVLGTVILEVQCYSIY